MAPIVCNVELLYRIYKYIVHSFNSFRSHSGLVFHGIVLYSTVAQRWHVYVFIYLVLTRYLSRAHELLSRAHELLCRAHGIISQWENTKTYMNVVWNWLIIAETILFYYILIQNADLSAPKHTYTVGYWHISTITSVHISEQQHFYC